MLSAGEASGDLHGATLCRGFAALAPAWQLCGMGGPRMAAAGMRVIADVTGDAVIGGSEVLGRLPALYRAFRRLARPLRQGPPPRALGRSDFPEFNLRPARLRRPVGVPS